MRFRTLLLPLATIGLLAACGSSTKSSGATTTTATGGPSTTAVGALPKPVVKLPATLPTTLVITDLKDGTGTPAANGDTVVVHYIGVRSADGKEFDNSFDRGTPFPVTVGVGQVIKGWDQGLVGVKTGGTRNPFAAGSKPAFPAELEALPASSTSPPASPTATRRQARSSRRVTRSRS